MAYASRIINHSKKVTVSRLHFSSVHFVIFLSSSAIEYWYYEIGLWRILSAFRNSVEL